VTADLRAGVRSAIAWYLF